MFAGAQVASRVSVPLCVSSFAVPSSLVFPPDGGVWSSLSSSLCARRYSFTSISISVEMRLRKRTSVQPGIFYFKFIPWDTVSHFDPAVIRIHVEPQRLIEIEK